MKKVIGTMAIPLVLMVLSAVLICCVAAEWLGFEGAPDYV